MNDRKPTLFDSKHLYVWIVLLVSAATLLFTIGYKQRSTTTTPVLTANVTATTAVTTRMTTTTVHTTTTAIVTTASTTVTTTTTQTTTTTTTVPTTSPTHVAAQPLLSDGVTPSLWTAVCNEYITLRTAPHGSAIITIPAGDTMILLGWNGTYAKVSYYGLVGYVLADWIAPTDGINAGLTVVSVTDQYAYAQMCADIDALCTRYPTVCSRDSIGKSELGRDIPVLKLGSESASHHVLIQGAIHGLEHMTAWVLMAIADSTASRGVLPQDVCFHIIPMSNPDGVVLAQTAGFTDTQLAIYADDVSASYATDDIVAYATQWKANGMGVDLNRNFDAGWAAIDGRKAPSSERYKGEKPFSAAESRALRDYTLSRPFDATISYHATGSIIYYEFGSAQPINSLSQALGDAVDAVTGYGLVGSDSVEGGGYKDWAMDKCNIPSITIEIGCDDTPLAFREVYNVLYRNLSVPDAVAQWVKQ